MKLRAKVLLKSVLFVVRKEMTIWWICIGNGGRIHRGKCDISNS